MNILLETVGLWDTLGLALPVVMGIICALSHIRGKRKLRSLEYELCDQMARNALAEWEAPGGKTK